jgi:hypothetical protein
MHAQTVHSTLCILDSGFRNFRNRPCFQTTLSTRNAFFTGIALEQGRKITRLSFTRLLAFLREMKMICRERSWSFSRNVTSLQIFFREAIPRDVSKYLRKLNNLNKEKLGGRTKTIFDQKLSHLLGVNLRMSSCNLRDKKSPHFGR